MDITQNYFEFLALPVTYQLDLQALSERSRELQKTLHPDRFSHLSDRERRLSVQYTAYLNEAVSTLKNPLSRAQYLLKLKGFDTFSESQRQLDPMFLMQQMELRESLAEISATADPEAELDALRATVEQELRSLREQFDKYYQQSTPSSFEAAAVCVRKMQFFDKLGREIEALEDQLFDE
ncbi:Fe-S protein assembly co-chaperone HscB [Amphritea pacifica]|uniref:Co-chaperone protein HscB homolog n=1 Tax=Amphritea pacifica TaxID=2811233 RepID=A0ABS2WBQ2_9GAMM|nr:Fe-S protein assembly co-chaperone HscB [Amphritea pacifica]MBN0989149.1 Fe-S protein assembly co-chaperone HscB [Amphritea pacifica]MBN1008128.1 Fe-S protein assembly co-chaperone HscB [Amphritea pacifica]